MTDKNDNAALEREEITHRLANFKATQERFQREREEYFARTLKNALATGAPTQRMPLWS